MDINAAPRPTTVLLTCLALTWLNPHVYLDTVLLLGTAANTWGTQRWWFGIGSWLASIVWFTGLGFGARSVAGFFARPQAWRMLDAGVAAVMVTMAALLVAY